MKLESHLLYDAERALRGILREWEELRLHSEPRSEALPDCPYDLLLTAEFAGRRIGFAIDAKKRVTPQTAIAYSRRLASLARPDLIPVLYAPVISPRVAAITKSEGVGYLDQSGNCWLKSASAGLLIERQGFQSANRSVAPAVAIDAFSPKSSRIVRVMLSQPTRGWLLRELAEHPTVGVSMGLASKVKHKLLEEGYLVERERMLYLRDPLALLADWSAKYSGPAEKKLLYARGELHSLEQRVVECCRHREWQVALAGFSAAWRQAPDVRYHVATLYVEEDAFNSEGVGQLINELFAKTVDSGHVLELWKPYDRSVFAEVETSADDILPATSPLQTYLDLRRTPGRGEEAASALFDKRLRRDLHIAAEQVREQTSGDH